MRLLNMNLGFKLAACQMMVAGNMEENTGKALRLLEEAARGKADVAVLPEMFNCPYGSGRFREYARKASESETLNAISTKAREFGMYVIAGSIPEEDDGRFYNTCFVYDRSGKLIGRHRKLHLYDVDLKGKIRFMESETLSPGNDITVVDTEFCRIGIGICYDIRFPEQARLMALRDAEVLVYPGVFNTVTGEAHWELLTRMRAVDNQTYVAAVSAARDNSSSYKSYGNSMVAGPWGNVLCRAGEDEEVVYADIDPSEIVRVRNELPLLKHRRKDIYRLESGKMT
jgi:predicted amidohydrolase